MENAAVAHLHGFRTWHALRRATPSAANITPQDSARPTLKVRMGVQGLPVAAGQAASRHLHDVLSHLLMAHDRRHWQLDVTVDRTSIEEVRAAIGHLLADAPDEEVSDRADFVLPSGFSEDEHDALQQDAMEVILVVREYAWAHATATAPNTVLHRPNRFEYDIATITQDLETLIPAAVLNPVPMPSKRA